MPQLLPFFTSGGQPGAHNGRQLELASVNRKNVRAFTFEAALNEIKAATRPLTLGLIWTLPTTGPSAVSVESAGVTSTASHTVVGATAGSSAGMLSVPGPATTIGHASMGLGVAGGARGGLPGLDRRARS
eukprot:COSAG01_NODE_28432_length_661_cov_1.069395_1_plen_129_part_10